MDAKSLITFIFLVQAIINVNLAMALAQNFKCSKKDFNSDAPLEERDVAFDLLYKSLAPPESEYNGYSIGGARDMWTKALCPPNIKKQACQDCVKNTIPYLKRSCSKKKEGAAWTVLKEWYCMVHYADSPSPYIEEHVWFSAPPTQPPVNVGELEKGLNNLANKLKGIIAATSDSAKKYGSGSVSYGPGSRTLYGSMQCLSPVSKVDCQKCLSDVANVIHDCCSKNSKSVGSAFFVKCNFWYSQYNFLPKTLPTNSTTSAPHLL